MGLFSSPEMDHWVYKRTKERPNDLTFVLKGSIAPFIEVSLRTGEGLVCDSAAIISHDQELEVRSWPGLNGKRWLVVNSEHTEECKVLLGNKSPGRAAGYDLAEYGNRLIVPAANLLANGPGVTAGYYARFRPLGLSMVLLEGNGWAFLRTGGDVEEIQLDPGKQLFVRAHSVAAMSATVDFDMSKEAVGTAEGQAVDKNGFAVLTGPGHVWLQSIASAASVRPPAQTHPAPPKINEMRPGSLAFLNATSA